MRVRVSRQFFEFCMDFSEKSILSDSWCSEKFDWVWIKIRNWAKREKWERMGETWGGGLIMRDGIGLLSYLIDVNLTKNFK